MRFRVQGCKLGRQAVQGTGDYESVSEKEKSQTYLKTSLNFDSRDRVYTSKQIDQCKCSLWDLAWTLDP